MIFLLGKPARELWAFILLFLAVTPIKLTHAQTPPPDIPGSAQASRLEDRLLAPQLRQKEEIVAPEKLAISENIPQAEQGFILKGIILEGNTVFSRPDFQDIIVEYIGRKVDLRVLNHLAARLTQQYRDSGYFLSRAVIPQQEVLNGKVKIVIMEGRVGEVFIEGDQSVLSKSHLHVIPATIEKIKSLEPLHGPTLERYMLLLNEGQGYTIGSVLRAPERKAEPGTIDIVLNVQPVTPSTTVSYNNYGSRFVGPHQISATHLTGNIFTAMDTLSVQGSSTIPLSEVQFGAVNYTLPLNREGLKASVLVSYSNSEPGYTLSDLEVEGDSTSFEATLSYPWIRSRKENLTIGSTFSVHNSSTEFLDEEFIDDKVRTISFFQNYDFINGVTASNEANITFTKGLDILGARETGSEDLSRQQGRSDFFKAEIELSRQQTLGEDFQLTLTAAGQYAPHPLLSSQEFGYGGTTFGRAYDPSELTGDQGVSAGAELRYTDVPLVPDLNLQFIPFVYYDIGKVWNHDRGEKPQSGASAGFGSYYNFNNKFSGSLQFAYPLTRSVTTPVMNGADGPRILFSISTSF